jgi:hypothetical protein
MAVAVCGHRLLLLRLLLLGTSLNRFMVRRWTQQEDGGTASQAAKLDQKCSCGEKLDVMRVRGAAYKGFLLARILILLPSLACYYETHACIVPHIIVFGPRIPSVPQEWDERRNDHPPEK